MIKNKIDYLKKQEIEINHKLRILDIEVYKIKKQKEFDSEKLKKEIQELKETIKDLEKDLLRIGYRLKLLTEKKEIDIDFSKLQPL